MSDTPTCPSCNDAQAGAGVSDCKLLIAAYILAGLAMMLNIRLSYSSAPYALIRFRLPENLFSVFVRRMASALELWCLPSMLLGNIMELALKGYYKHQKYNDGDFTTHKGNLKDTAKSTISITTGNNNKNIIITNLPHVKDTFTPRQIKFGVITVPSIISQWLNFLTYVILLFVYRGGGDQGHLTVFYFVIAISGVVFGINMTLVYAADFNYVPVYIVGENSFPIVTSFIHYLSTLTFGNRRKWNSDYLIVYIDIWVAIIISLVAAVLWSLAYGYFRDTKKTVTTITHPKEGKDTTGITGTIKTGTVTQFKCTAETPAGSFTDGKAIGTKDPTTGPTLTGTITNATALKAISAGTECTVTETTEGSTKTTLTIKYEQDSEKKCIKIEITSGIETTSATVPYGHVFTYKFSVDPNTHLLSPFLMIVVGMGLVYAIYPGIAPGMIVPFYLVDKIEMVLLVATLFPPVIIAILRRYKPKLSPQYFDNEVTFAFKKWSEYDAGKFYLFLDILMVIKITLAVIFIYSLHYKESHLSRSIINQPKMSTYLSITFYMCHEILLALGFSGFIGNNGGDLILIPQYIGALFMIFLAFYSEGYIIEYKSHDAAHWPTEGMTPWNAFCYWCKRAIKITNHNLMSLFKNYLFRGFVFFYNFLYLSVY